MPAYNTKKYISEAIESILNQTFTDFEFIIDNCSMDGSWEIIKEYAEKDKRIIALRNEDNPDIISSRNRLINLAKGKYIVWQDSDDISLPSRLEHQYNFMEANEEVGICGGWLEFFTGDKKLGIRKYEEHDRELKRNVFKYAPVAQPAAIIRKEALSSAGLYDYDYLAAEDLDMSFRIGKKYNFANLQEIVVRYRENIAGGTFIRLRMMELKTISIRLKYLDNKIYKMTSSDYLYNILHFISIFIFPPKLKIRLFSLLRNSK